MDQRADRSRKSVVSAFAQLSLDHRYDDIRVGDLVAAAGIGRSTFYEHFRGKDSVLLAAMEPILLTLASAITGRASQSQVRATLKHLWDRRSLGRVILSSRASSLIQRRLAAMIEARLEPLLPAAAPESMVAMAAAAAELALLRMWLAGEAACSADALARQMIALGPRHQEDEQQEQHGK
jgi:AcrR family transcriptional regulator